mmetsp:Transcript_41318/g.76888  ORF Transcript_41318/g.76888 Transcript_41318/m.76888 type:complete len:204 (-) Transcript_41318:1385-1996(-)
MASDTVSKTLMKAIEIARPTRPAITATMSGFATKWSEMGSEKNSTWVARRYMTYPVTPGIATFPSTWNRTVAPFNKPSSRTLEDINRKALSAPVQKLSEFTAIITYAPLLKYLKICSTHCKQQQQHAAAVRLAPFSSSLSPRTWLSSKLARMYAARKIARITAPNKRLPRWYVIPTKKALTTGKHGTRFLPSTRGELNHTTTA